MKRDAHPPLRTDGNRTVRGALVDRRTPMRYGGYIAFERYDPGAEIDGRPTMCGACNTLLGLEVEAKRQG